MNHEGREERARRRTLGRTEIALAVLFALAIIAAGSIALVIVINQPKQIYTDPAAIPSAASAPPAEPYASAVEEVHRCPANE